MDLIGGSNAQQDWETVETSPGSVGDWGAYQLHTITGVYLPAGHHLLRSYVENDGFNLDYIELTLTDSASFTVWSQGLLSGIPDNGPADNPDADAYSNEMEMLMGTNPSVPIHLRRSRDSQTGTGS